MDEPIGDGKVDAVPQLPFSSYYGLLARAPARHSPVIEEAIASGEPLPESAVGSPQGS
jgi:circadian clock protein KaiC